VDATESRLFTRDVITAVDLYIGRAYQVVPLDGKKPRIRKWTTSEIPAHWFMTCDNIGLKLGQPSNGLVDVDLDCPEAVLLAPEFLPDTGMMFSRADSQSAHRFYRVTNPPATATIKFGGLVEVRSTGGQKMVPPSIHPDTDERLAWPVFGDPAQVELSYLCQQVGLLAAAALVLKHWTEPNRHDLALGLAGALCQADWTEDRILSFVQSIAVAAGDDELEDRERAVEDTWRNYTRDSGVTGWVRLAELVGQSVVDQVRG
jgi:hypothetical protein